MIDTSRNTKADVYQKAVQESRNETSIGHSVQYWKSWSVNHVFCRIANMNPKIQKIYKVKNTKMNNIRRPKNTLHVKKMLSFQYSQYLSTGRQNNI